ncbi:MAG TPA: DUF971 domain-containing protein [Thiobacillaceae bacterium]|nr:DUF971 domain-containing protein [Thiobacillaceae bacterium]
MSGLNKDTPIPTEIKLHQASHKMEIAFDDGSRFELPYEYLRVYSPSAEVRGHGQGQEKLQVGKKNVAIDHIEPVGNYAVCLFFNDQHNTGIYSWDYLYDLGAHYDVFWQDYLKRMEAAGASREPASAQYEQRPKSK